MLPELSRPFDGDLIMQSKRKLLRLLKEKEQGAVPLKIAVLGGSTTSDIIKILELFLRDRGIVPSFYESEYAQYWSDAVFGNRSLTGSSPSWCSFTRPRATLRRSRASTRTRSPSPTS